LTSVDVGYEKPQEEIFLQALKALNVKAKEAVMVGNRISRDIVGANHVGMHSVLFKWNDRYPERPKSLTEQPTYTISSLKELPTILLKLNRKVED
jgi:putative hydrolase of the HAD superfamily